ncbi:putative colanic acid biosynthesis acetyltransferase [Wenzhouxiangella sediminis]|uniref:Putative colanic acid biosynthesis acetyltransferase n=1 Tax=Wenzhouxiangella sediminis TaxID=1792836 RepID=A0A3E1K6I5_9GAMM|nr:putative colanic acid biosynthesis acetyltransferase [Wenzhouxiangella sediminis]
MSRVRLKHHHISTRNRAARVVWQLVWLLLFRPTPRVMHKWRQFLLRLFGARIAGPSYVYPSARIWAPWNLELGEHATIGENVDCYSVAKIRIGAYSTVSQYSFLCSASHDFRDPAILRGPEMPLVAAPITIGERAWVTADVFVAPGVTIGDGAVILARSTVVEDVPAWTVMGGNPAAPQGPRKLRSSTRREDLPE